MTFIDDYPLIIIIIIIFQASINIWHITIYKLNDYHIIPAEPVGVIKCKVHIRFKCNSLGM